MKVLMLLVVFLAALLLHYIVIVKEKFSDSGSAGIEFTFSNLVNALLEASSPPEQTTNSSEATCAQTQNELIRDIRDVVSMEIDSKLSSLRYGPRDTMNGALASRNTPVGTTAAAAPAAPVTTDGLVQGQDYQTDASCPYAAGQAPPQAALQGVDMNDYIRKDSIPCWGCSLK